MIHDLVGAWPSNHSSSTHNALASWWRSKVFGLYDFSKFGGSRLVHGVFSWSRSCKCECTSCIHCTCWRPGLPLKDILYGKGFPCIILCHIWIWDIHSKQVYNLLLALSGVRSFSIIRPDEISILRSFIRGIKVIILLAARRPLIAAE